MKKTILFVIFCVISISSFSQAEASNWYFGYGAGINFNQINGEVSALNDGQLFTNEGSAAISDSFGNLLFYTDGITIWNKNHGVMTNGSGLNGDPSSTQSAIIVPKPNTPDIYYVFTVDDHNPDEPHYGFNYSEVDMTLSGGLGAVITKNVNLIQDCSEKLSAVVKDCETKSIWVLAFASESGLLEEYNTFHAFEVSDLGINTTAVKSTFPLAINDYRGNLKISPDGKKMACANVSADRFFNNVNDRLLLFDFDSATGQVSNLDRVVVSGSSNFPYGIEFSPNSELLYVHASNDYNGANRNVPSNHTSVLLQYELLAGNVQSSEVVIDSRSLYRGGLQLGPNGKIYRALSATYDLGLSNLGVINNPNAVGIACDYEHNGLSVSPNLSSQGLPPFIQSFFNEKVDIINNGTGSSTLDLCDGDKYTLSAPDIAGATYIWTVNKTPLSNTAHDIEVSSTGNYEVFIDLNDGNCGVLEGQAFVSLNPNPEAYNDTLLQCDEDGTTDGLTVFNLNKSHNNLTGGILDRSLKFYTDSARTIEVNGNNFPNTSNPQTIYVEVIDDTSGCSSFSELTLQASVTDANNTELMHCDDDGTEDGFHIFNLNDANINIVNGLPTGLNVTYFETYDDALIESNNITGIYTNTKPYSQTIFARVENANNCYGISDVLLTVNPLPNIETESLEYYCLNDFPNTVSIDAGPINGSPNNYNFSWSNGDTSYETEINTVGTFTVTVTDKTYGCSKTRTVTVAASNIATFSAPAFNVTDAVQNNTITVLVSGEGTYQYSLIDSNNLTIKPFQDSNLFENIYPGIYQVAVKDVKNDCGIVNENVSVIGFPKYFTPNNDGMNDTWQILGVSNQFQAESKVYIYNRFGKLLKEITATEKGWDGTLNGQVLPSDDYWFSVKLEDGRVYKNHFSLIN
ncbi:T9SS type B sorting domain-containing protein [Algibacter amylolyticus]|uniref:T9SS type B sorting domain-containing protein n=1 Tax=Algibacter amylolyticus TaxID=1608400 RepID=A0A5M7B4W9_9FLAO|nr:T9SS type B sorting domain-containing protein [Algibacter amylolyticus]KAA5824429.1 T9SS type B sorting domain-containing protein [Algibacter amylolyticus]MBB5269513.1 gliding motility-associated-like protein [Algibacter amylolyticus]TSJ75202.1 T9SS type B sorting domain-containing protein [Algibacter amylolyticus]